MKYLKCFESFNYASIKTPDYKGMTSSFTRREKDKFESDTSDILRIKEIFSYFQTIKSPRVAIFDNRLKREG